MTKEVAVKVGDVVLMGNLEVPKEALGVVLFAHGSGSSRFSPRNQYVAGALNKAGLGTFLIDLLSKEEEMVDEQTAELRFDINMLSERLTKVVDWLTEQKETGHLKIALFGASTGAAAALITASKRADTVKAVVSRGGRPDLAKAALDKVKAPTLLIVGGYDGQVIELNEMALAKLRCEKDLVIVPKATHLFEEKGALEEVARLAKEWFITHLSKPAKNTKAV